MNRDLTADENPIRARSMPSRSSRASADAVHSLEYGENSTILRRSGSILPETIFHETLCAIG